MVCWGKSIVGERGIKSLILITGRTIQQGMSMESDGKYSEKYYRSVAVIELNPAVIQELGISDRVRVKSCYGEVVVSVKPSKDLPVDKAFIPLGPWANAVVDYSTESIGMPNFKSTVVTIEPVDEPVTSLKDLLERYGVRVTPFKPMERPLESGGKRVVKNYVCPFCGELCDYLELELVGDRIVRNKGGCPLSIAKTLNYHRDRILKPFIRRGGCFKEVSIEEAIEEAAHILSKSMYPLLFGWSSTCTEAIELGVELAELVGGIIDNTSVFCHGPTALGAQETGTARATLGVIRHLADVIVLWGCNPLHAHPNHFARWITARGRHVDGRRDRRVVVVDVRKTATARTADLFIEVEPGRDYELITALRMAVRELEIEAPVIAGVSREKVLELADIMKSARYGVIFAGMGVTMTGAKYRNLEELVKLVHDLNEWTRFVLLPMRGHYNVTGANEASLWSTGYPFAIDYSRGYPRMITGLSTATELLVRGDVDATLIIASDPVAHMPQKAVEHLARIPVIVVDPKWCLSTAVADVIIPSGIVGIECSGTAYRLDGVPIRMHKVVDPPPGVLCDVDILTKLLNRVKELKEG